MMKSAWYGLVLLAGLSVTPFAQAEPGGCLKYGAAGAVGGHLVHHGVLGAMGGCTTGMVRRHEYRKGLREKAALWDREHPADPNQSWWQRHHNALTYQQKAALWDKENPQGGAPGGVAPVAPGAAAPPPGAPN